MLIFRETWLICGVITTEYSGFQLPEVPGTKTGNPGLIRGRIEGGGT
jgi:hypothetical protein